MSDDIAEPNPIQVGRPNGNDHRPGWARPIFIVAVLVLVGAAGWWASMTLSDRQGTSVGDRGDHFYPVFGDLHDVGVQNPSIFGTLWTSPSGQELPLLDAADAEAGAPMVASLQITDLMDVDTSHDYTAVAVNGQEGLLHTSEETMTDPRDGTEIELDFVTSKLIWPIGGGLWAILDTTLPPDREPAESTLQIAEGVTFTDRATWLDRNPFATVTPTSAPTFDETTSSSIPGSNTTTTGTPAGAGSVSTTSGPP